MNRSVEAGTSIHPDTRVGQVSLTISNMEKSLDFYQQSLGFQVHRRSDKVAYLGAGKEDLLLLKEVAGVKRANRTAGLYHFALLVPSRKQLAFSLQNLGQTQTPVQGFADHLVSEAIYLADPDGNGIEIYRDRPRHEWFKLDGELQMGTEPLDIDGVMAELNGNDDSWSGLDAQTQIGHIHLHVADLDAAEEFYTRTLGFDLIMRYGPSAAFVSAGGYHHHIGFNTWAGTGIPPAPADAIGLRYFSIHLPSEIELRKVLAKMQKFEVPVLKRPEGFLVRDPSGNGLIFMAENTMSI